MASSISLPSPSSLSSFPFPLHRPTTSAAQTRKPHHFTKTYAARREAAGHDQHNDFQFRPAGRLVDENMIVLRKRIHEMKTEEMAREAPEGWMDWEKQIYSGGSYDSMICDAMGHLQSHLMESRPSLVLGMAALIAFSVPASTAFLAFKFLELARAVL